MKHLTLALISTALLAACGGGSDGGTSPTTTYTTAEKIQNKPTVPVFSPWGANQAPNSNCGQDTLWMDCDTTETPYAMVWVNRESHGMNSNWKTDVASPLSGMSAEQIQRYTTDPNTLYIVAPMWNYWFEQWNTLAPNISYYMDELFQPHEGDDLWARAYNLNILDPELHSSLVEKATNIKADGGNGILFDWWHNGADGRWAGAEDDLFTDEEVQQARVEIAQKIRAAVGEDFIIMGNTNWAINDPSAEYLSGVFLELAKSTTDTRYPTYKEDGSSSIEEIEEVISYWNTALSGLKVIAVEPWNIGGYEERLSDENIQLAELFTAMTLVIADNGYILYPDQSIHSHQYYDVFHTDLGKPIGEQIEVSEGVSYKEFEQGYAIYNRTDLVSTFEINGENITVQGLSGLFLVN
ncbi:putative glycoside hydrolase family 15 protein [Agarivorans aestuarii]|uniref:putative glycoside hydrolase family 15 protein n=1 Tax=Agarivorans aestuarii TaxID=1563703 RepID=UPI001C811DF5|nr:putative glycoside hydrolase family 15 protein [Agarivorans aestuarii]